MFQADIDKKPEIESFIDYALIPWYELEYVDDIGEYPGLFMVNPSSEFWFASPQVDLPDDGQYRFNIERPHKRKAEIVMNQADTVAHLIDARNYLSYNSTLNQEEVLSKITA